MKNQFLLSFVLGSSALAVSAQTPLPHGPELPCQTSWIGNSFGGADNKWVQDQVDEIEVTPAGTVVTASAWDEAERCTGLYKNGNVNPNLLKQYDGKGETKAWGWGTASSALALGEQFIYLVNTAGELLRFRLDN
jgi:hypothetical protein